MVRLRRLRQTLASLDRGQLLRLASLTGLFFLIVCALGVLRPIKNALALTGLAEGQFYKVYLVSAAVVLFVPGFNRVADRIPWRRLLPLTAAAFAALLLGLRAWYGAGSALFGLLFYGWYDLIAAVLVTQFFMATQLLFDAREAKKFYPVVIAGGSLGATLGGAVTGFTAERVGLPNLMLVAAALILAFAVILPLLWRKELAQPEGIEVIGSDGDEGGFPGLREIRRVFGNRQVRLITLAVLLTVLVKQLVDYQFNTLSDQVFVTEAAISEFQGWFNAGTQWLPLVVLASLGPVLRRWGVGVVLFMFPVFMVLANVGLAASWSLAAAVVAKGGDTAIRYAAERTSREILYVPIPEDLKLRAKGWIDVAVEKGLGKALSALVIFGLLQVMDFRSVGWVAAGLAAGGVALSHLLRGEYVESLARSLETGAASLRGIFASLTGAEALPALRRAIREGGAGRIAFTLDLLGKGAPEDRRALADELTELLSHPEPSIRRKALEVLAAEPENLDPDAVRPLLRDGERTVREAAVEALAAAAPEEELAPRLRELLREDPPVRHAVLSCLAGGQLPVRPEAVLGEGYLADREIGAGDAPEARLELALAAGAMAHEPAEARRHLSRLVDDPEPAVASAALRSAGRVADPELDRTLVEALGRPPVRAAAADALVHRGPEVLDLLAAGLGDPGVDLSVRRHIPGVLARIPSQDTVDALLASYGAPETDQLLDYRTLKALNKLRDREDEDYRFPRETVTGVLRREVDAYRRYGRAVSTLEGAAAGGPGLDLLRRSVREARAGRRESTFRCLGLLLPPRDVYRCYLAVTRGDRKARANAVEWVEYEGDRALYRQVRPVLEDRTPAAGGRDEDDPAGTLVRLAGDKDRWIARCALWSLGETFPDRAARLLDDFRSPDPHLEDLADRLRRGAWGPAASADGGGEGMETIEKVFLLKEVDVLAGADSSQLARVAELAEEVRAEEDALLLRRGRPSSAMYLLLDGSVQLEGESQQLRLEDRGDAFGTWALIDEEPSMVDARAAEASRLLRVRRAPFEDLLADNPELAMDLLRGLSRRVRRVLAG